MARERQIVGLSLSPDTAQKFKGEAKRRGMPVRQLFEEMWANYTPPASK